MKRKLIVGERIMYVDAHTPLNGVFPLKIKGNFTLPQLEAAWHKIQQKHYLLQAVIEEDANGIPYFTSKENIDKIDIRLVDRVSDDDWKLQSKIEWTKLFNQPNSPLIRFVWIKGETFSDFLIVCSHCVCDGSTVACLMSDLLLLLDNPATELAGYKSFDSVTELLTNSFSATKGKIIKTKLLAGLAAGFFFLKPTSKYKPIGETFMLHWKISKEETAAITTKCKANGVTAHAALCVAFMEAFKFVKGDKAHGKVISPVDIRRFVKEIRSDQMFAFAPIVELTLGKDKKNDFWQKAQQLRDQLTSKMKALKAHEMLVMSEYFHSTVSGMIKFLRSTKGTHDITLSNMGRLLGIKEKYDSFEVVDMYSPSVSFPWRNANTVVISTFKGKMDFTFCSNNSFLNEATAKAIQDKTVQILQESVAAYV